MPALDANSCHIFASGPNILENIEKSGNISQLKSLLYMYATVTLQISLATCGDLMRLDCSMKGLHNSVVTTFK